MQITQAAALQAHANGPKITPQQIESLLKNVSVTFAGITYVTKVQLAAEHANAGILINKVTEANVMLCSNIKAHTAVYKRKVQRSAHRLLAAQHAAQPMDIQSRTDAAMAIADFQAAPASYTHTATHSIVHNNKNVNALYLYCFYNNASSVYMQDNAVVTKQHVAAYCTRSAAQALLEPKATVHNVTHDITHDVQVRTISLHNIVSIRARKQLLTV